MIFLTDLTLMMHRIAGNDTPLRTALRGASGLMTGFFCVTLGFLSLDR